MKHCRKNTLKSRKGITLIALVITIIVLLILAGISISMLSGDNGILQRATHSKEKTIIASEIEQIQLEVLGSYETNGALLIGRVNDNIKNHISGVITDDATQFPLTVTYTETRNNYKVYENGKVEEKIIKIPEGLTIGSTVVYNPSGTYNWKAKYATSNKSVTKTDNNTTVEDDSNDILLSSESDGTFQITSWKVLSIDKENDKIELIPNAPTTGTVTLQGSQGYNNAVKLLNDACDALYSMEKNGKKLVKARSICMDDFERVLTDEALEARYDYATSECTYNQWCTEAYTSTGVYATTYRDSNGNYIIFKNYPRIYANERDSIINQNPTGGTLSLSEQTEFIERIDANLQAVSERVTTANSIRPKLTYYLFETSYNSTYKTHFKNYDSNNSKSFADLLSPRGSNTSYWIATRCTGPTNNACMFDVRYVRKGFIYFAVLGRSDSASAESSAGYSAPLFPVVSLSSELIDGNTSLGFKVE